MSSASKLLGVATYSWPNGHVVVRLVGHVDGSNANRFVDEIGRLDLDRTLDVVVHMEDVTFLDHEAVAVLAAMRDLAADRQCTLTVRSPSLQALAVLELCGFEPQPSTAVRAAAEPPEARVAS